MLLQIVSPLVAALLLSACTGTPQPMPAEEAPPPPSITDADDACGARTVQDRVGREYTGALGEAIAEESGAATIRVMRPGEAHTLEYRGDRLNVRLDEDGVITDIGCG